MENYWWWHRWRREGFVQFSSMDVRAGPQKKKRWSTKELMLSNCCAGEDSWESLECKEIKPVKEINPKYSLEGLMLKLKLQYCGHLIRRTNPLEKILMLGKIEGKRRRGWKRMRWLDSITNSMDMSLSKFQETVEDRGAWQSTFHGVAKSHT